MKRKIRSTALAGILLVSLSACQRSAAFKQDQEYYKETEAGQSYYFKPETPNKTPTQRIAQMGQPKKRVYVFDFWNQTPVRIAQVDRYAADELRRTLFQTQRVILPPDVKTEMTTASFVQGEDRVKVAQLIREARQMGVAVVVIGRISRIVFRQKGDEVGLFRQKQSLAAVDLEAKVFDVSAGREISAVTRSGEASSNSFVVLEDRDLESQKYRAELAQLAIRNAMTGLAGEVLKAIEKMAWQGRVVKVLGSKVYINAGRASGLVTGDILRVVSQGEEIHDPQTGVFLGRTEGQVKGTLEVKDFIGPDGCVTEVHSGANFQEGDQVQLY